MAMSHDRIECSILALVKRGFIGLMQIGEIDDLVIAWREVNVPQHLVAIGPLPLRFLGSRRSRTRSGRRIGYYNGEGRKTQQARKKKNVGKVVGSDKSPMTPAPMHLLSFCWEPPALGAKPLFEGRRRFGIGSPRSHRRWPRGLSLGFARMPTRGTPRSVVSLEEAPRSAAAAVYAWPP